MDDLSRLKIGLALTGSHCTFEDIVVVARNLVNRGAEVFPIASARAFDTDTRFGEAEHWREQIENIAQREFWHTVVQVEPIGPENLLDVVLIAPCTGNTMSKLANGITDGPVTMAAKAHLRNRRSVVLGISTNDALGLNAKNLGSLMAAEKVFFIPFRQDDPHAKPTSCVARWDLAGDAVKAAAEGQQLQPVLVGPPE